MIGIIWGYIGTWKEKQTTLHIYIYICAMCVRASVSPKVENQPEKNLANEMETGVRKFVR